MMNLHASDQLPTENVQGGVKPILPRRAVACYQVVAFGVVVGLGLLTEILHYRALTTLQDWATVAALFAALPRSTPKNRAVLAVLLAAGLCLPGITGTGAGNLPEGLGSMMALCSLIACASTMAIPIRLGGYAAVFRALFERKNTGGYTQYFVWSLIAYLLAVPALIGSVPIAYQLLTEPAGGKGGTEYQRFLVTAIARGYAMAIVWSPVAANVGLALNYAGIAWSRFALPAFFLSLLGLLLAAALGGGKGMHPVAWPLPANSPGSPFSHVAFFGCLLGGVVLLIVFFERYAGIGPIGSIAVGCFAAVLCWGVLTRRMWAVARELGRYFGRDIGGLADYVVLFAAAGFFTHALERTGIIRSIGSFLAYFAGLHGQEVILLLLPLCIVGLALAGFHPFASAAVFARSLTLILPSVPPVSLALALTSGVAVAFIVSPFAGITMYLAGQTKRTPFEVGLGWNGPYVLLFLGVAGAAVFLTRLF